MQYENIYCISKIILNGPIAFKITQWIHLKDILLRTRLSKLRIYKRFFYVNTVLKKKSMTSRESVHPLPVRSCTKLKFKEKWPVALLGCSESPAHTTEEDMYNWPYLRVCTRESEILWSKQCSRPPAIMFNHLKINTHSLTIVTVK